MYYDEVMIEQLNFIVNMLYSRNISTQEHHLLLSFHQFTDFYYMFFTF